MGEDVTSELDTAGETAAALRKRNFDLAKTHERLHDGRRVYVIGATLDATEGDAELMALPGC